MCGVTTGDCYAKYMSYCLARWDARSIQITGSNASPRPPSTNKCMKQSNIELQPVAVPPHYIGIAQNRHTIVQMLCFVYLFEPVSRCVALLPVIAMPNKCIVFLPDGMPEVYKSVVVTLHIRAFAQRNVRNKALLSSNERLCPPTILGSRKIGTQSFKCFVLYTYLNR